MFLPILKFLLETNSLHITCVKFAQYIFSILDEWGIMVTFLHAEAIFFTLTFNSL